MWSKDGGKTFERGFGGGDNHDAWIAPNDPKRIIVAHDNGAIITTDGGTTSLRVAAPTGQFYHAYLTNHVPYHVCGAKQDAGSSCGPVRAGGFGGRGGGGGFGGRGGRGGGGPQYSDFYGVAGGESGYIAGDPLDPDITYGGNYSGVLEKQDRASGLSERLDPWPLNPMGHDAKDSKYRFQWTYPIMNSPHDPHVLYVGSNVVFKSSNDGATWQVISPDLTRHDPATLRRVGRPDHQGPDVDRVLRHGLRPRRVAAQRRRHLGRIRRRPHPRHARRRQELEGRDAEGTARMDAHLHHRSRRRTPRAPPGSRPTATRWTTSRRTSTGPPTTAPPGRRSPTASRPTEFTRAIREDLVRPGLLYASTERGMWVSYDAGEELAEPAAQPAAGAGARHRAPRR